LSSSRPNAVAIDESRVVGEGSYGVVVAAVDDEDNQYVAKRARKDEQSRRYFDIEKNINEKLQGTIGLAPYRGVVEGPTPEKGFFEPATTRYLMFDRVAGGRDAETYLNDGSCGVDGLAAALGLDACAYEEMCFVDGGEECTADPQQARSGSANVVVASVVLSFLLDAVSSLEANQVIHRDVKASNILVEPSRNRLVLIDLGSAMDMETKVGYEAKRSPVSPRFCPPEQFVDVDAWRSFDAYGCGLVALRLLLSPALRSPNDVDAFNVEFAAARYDLDRWLATKLAQTALPERILAPLAALRSLKSGPALWKVVAKLLMEDPRARRTARGARVEAAKLQALLLREAEAVSVTDASPPRARDPALIPTRRRITLQAPLGLIVEENEAGIVVAEVAPGSNAAELGAPRVGDVLLSVEYVPKGGDPEPVFEDLELKASFEDALGALEKVPTGRMIELVLERGGGEDEALGPGAPVARVRLGAYRRRGSARAATEDCVAISAGNVAEVLSHQDWPAREPREEATPELLLEEGRGVACAVDGHGGQTASRHAADRLPALIASYAARTPEAALKAAWVRCAEELELDGPGGAVAALACVDVEAQTIALLHCGDARAVVVGRHRPAAAFETNDHTLRRASERAALANRGGAARGGRVLADQWGVSVPRALGGTVWRAAGISPAPDVASFPCEDADGLVLASDGLWDVMSSDDAAAFLRANRLFRPDRSAAQVAASLASRAAALGSTDDVSVVCVFFDR